MNIASQVENVGKLDPERLAMVFEGERFSYRELDQRAAGAARELERRGVRQGDRVALCLPNSPEFAFWYLGALRLGAIAVSLNPGLTESEIGFMLRDSGPCVTVTGLERPEPAEGPIVDLPGDTPAVIVYTSGTTGFPKGATLSHGNVMFVAESKRRYLDIRPDDRMLLFLPLFHCFGQNAIMNAAFAAGAAVVLQRGFDADRVMAAVDQDGVSMICGVPTNFIVLCERADPERMRKVRYFMSAAAPLPLEIERRWRQRFGVPLYQGYGLTECSPFASYNHHREYREGSGGTAIDGVEIAVADVETGRILPPGEKGEILVRGPNVMLGYWDRIAETRQTLAGGWLHTGDIGRIDRDGYLFVEDRLKDMVIVGGFNVYPAEVENVLYAHPAVSEAAVYGVPDAVLGERVLAAVVLRPGMAASPEELTAHCRPYLADYKLPSEFEFVAAVPKGRTGKVLKRVLRERYRPENSGGSDRIRNASELERRIAGWLGERLSIPVRGIEPDRPLADYGFASVLALELAEKLERWLGRRVDPTVSWNFPTVRGIAQRLMPDGSATAETGGNRMAAAIASLSEEEAAAMLMAELGNLGQAQAVGQG